MVVKFACIRMYIRLFIKYKLFYEDFSNVLIYTEQILAPYYKIFILNKNFMSTRFLFSSLF